MGSMLDADKHLQELLQESVHDYPDLYMEVGDALIQVGHLDKACEYLLPLLECPDASNVALWEKLAMCRRACSGAQGVASVYQDVLGSIDASHSGYIDAALLRIEALVEVSHVDEADKCMTQLDLLMKENKVLWIGGCVVGIFWCDLVVDFWVVFNHNQHKKMRSWHRNNP